MHRPYKDNYATIAPIIAGIAFLLSLVGYWGGMFAFVAFILFMSSCCCSMTKGGLVTTAVFGIISGVVSIIMASVYFNLSDDDSWLWEDDDDFWGDDYYNSIGNNGSSNNNEDLDDEDLRPFRVVGGILIVGAMAWFVAAVLLLVFVCARYDKMRAESMAAFRQSVAVGQQVAVVVPPAPTVLYPAQVYSPAVVQPQVIVVDETREQGGKY